MRRFLTFNDFDWVLLGLVLALSVISVLEIYSATLHTKFVGFDKNQVLWLLGGMAAMFGISLINYHRLLSIAVWAYGTHKLPISPPHYARILGDGQLQLEQLADAFNWLPNWRQQMPQRAAELKAQLSALVGDHPEVQQALQQALKRFECRADQSDSWKQLHSLIADQRWRLAHFRVAADDINYRRFFNINDLAGLRIELPEVFDR